MTWQRLETGAPELADLGKHLFEQTGVAVIGTVRCDGTPRINCVEPTVRSLGMMWQSSKALDLLRDRRVVLRNAICSSTRDEGEMIVRGRAIEIQDPETRRHYVEAVSERIRWTEPRFHLFSIDIESAAYIRYGDGKQSVKLWPQYLEYLRSYE